MSHPSEDIIWRSHRQSKLSSCMAERQGYCDNFFHVPKKSQFLFRLELSIQKTIFWAVSHPSEGIIWRSHRQLTLSRSVAKWQTCSKNLLMVGKICGFLYLIDLIIKKWNLFDIKFSPEDIIWRSHCQLTSSSCVQRDRDIAITFFMYQRNVSFF